VIHSEMPEQEQGVMEGFQLWLNLPARDKMTSPWYRDIQSDDIPEFVTPDGVKARVIAGASHGVTGAVQKTATEPLFLDLHLPANSRFAQPLPPGHNAFVYVYRGTARLGGQSVPEQRLAILSNSASADGVVVETQTDSRLLLIAGKPLGEPIVQQGPFVMNTQEEIDRAVNDFRLGRFA
jgi:redox-sensitive bicupin YhaK (pirin superfamily)